jgi:hypothetical protein
VTKAMHRRELKPLLRHQMVWTRVPRRFAWTARSSLVWAQISSLYLSDPSLEQLASGHFLYRVLEAIVEQPSFWIALIDAHRKQLLTERANQAFGWLLLKILSSRLESLPNVRPIAEQVTETASLINSPALEVRTLGQEIIQVLNTTSTEFSQGK